MDAVEAVSDTEELVTCCCNHNTLFVGGAVTQDDMYVEPSTSPTTSSTFK